MRSRERYYSFDNDFSVYNRVICKCWQREAPLNFLGNHCFPFLLHPFQPPLQLNPFSSFPNWFLLIILSSCLVFPNAFFEHTSCLFIILFFSRLCGRLCSAWNRVGTDLEAGYWGSGPFCWICCSIYRVLLLSFLFLEYTNPWRWFHIMCNVLKIISDTIFEFLGGKSTWNK